MPTLETTEIVNSLPPSEGFRQRPSLARDVPLVASGALLSSLFGILAVFVIPKILTVEEFGYWRLFLLYAGYVGVLHLGFGEGVFVRWAGKDFHSFHGEIGPSVRFLLALHALLLIGAGALCLLIFARPISTIAIALLLFAGVANVVTILQLSLQAARDFVPVTISAVAPVAIFVVATLLLAIFHKPGHRQLIGLYAFAWSVVLVFLWNRVAPFSGSDKLKVWAFAWENIKIGWPITVATFGLDFFASADRFVVSTAASIRQFAQYSLAASVVTVPLLIIGTIYRVFLPHLATKSPDEQSTAYQRASRLILLAWVVLLPYFVAVDLFIRRFLPSYEEAVPIAKVLVLAILFFALIRVLQMSVFNLSGNQRRFLVSAAAAVVTSLSLAFAAIVFFRSFVLVAWCQVFTAATWWTANEIMLSRIVSVKRGAWLQTTFVFAWSAAVFFVVTAHFSHAMLAIAAYYIAVSVPIFLWYRTELRLAFDLFSAIQR